MCGIIGIVGKQNVVEHLTDGLDRLAYRGYDSAGIATFCGNNIERIRAKGKIENLRNKLRNTDYSTISTTGIAHTRWATHGLPNERNAHPHATNDVALVHNGIIENYQTIRSTLHHLENLTSDTDSEVVAHALSDQIKQNKTPLQAFEHIKDKMEGAFAFVFMFSAQPDMLIGVRRGSPLAIGYGDDEMYFGSDALALAHLTRRISYLEEGDYAVITNNSASIYDASGNQVTRDIVQSSSSGVLTGKGNYRHYMLKEIHEQPTVIGDLLSTIINPQTRTLTLPKLPFDGAKINSLTTSACGTAYYAGLIGSYWFEDCARLANRIEIASELRYRNPVLQAGEPSLFLTQSGETMDTLEAMRMAKRAQQKTLAIVNVPESTIARETDQIIPMLAGPEIGVASTKAFTAMLSALAALALDLARVRNTMTSQQLEEHLLALLEIPAKMSECLLHEDQMIHIAEILAGANHALYLGRGPAYALAMEGALKLKEISYIHAEGYAAGEMKHGPIALIDEHMPVVVLAPVDALFTKTLSNMREAIARQANVIFISSKKGIETCLEQCQPAICFEVPDCHPFIAPIVYSIPMQLLAYHTACLKGTDIDQPRNLAKSVTVE